jgi:hypothetical protein
VAGSRQRLAGQGVAIVLAYLLVAWASVSAGLVSRSPLYDGLAGIPLYRWVNPPSEREGDNEIPKSEEFDVSVSTSGQADPGSVTTSDGQMTLTFNYLPPSPQPYAISVTMTPLDPAELAPAPDGYYFDSNAYKLETVDDATGAPVDGSFTSIMRFSVHGPQILSLNEGTWSPLPDPLLTDADLQVSAETPANGTYVAAGTGTRPPEDTNRGESFPWFSTIVGTIGLLLLFAAAVVSVRQRNGSSSR